MINLIVKCNMQDIGIYCDAFCVYSLLHGEHEKIVTCGEIYPFRNVCSADIYRRLDTKRAGTDVFKGVCLRAHTNGRAMRPLNCQNIRLYLLLLKVYGYASMLNLHFY